MQMLAGTSGYSYKEWLGHFYPPKLPAGSMLRYYAERLPTVEINNTFYRMPDPSMLARWLDEVPESFTFALKAPRRITHEKRLRDAGPDAAEFLKRASVLGSRLGVVLFQLPPFQRKEVERLRSFLAGLPPSPRAAFEFRHASWQDDEVSDALRAHGAMLCVAETDEGSSPLICTSDSTYLRLRRTSYEESDLRGWVDRLASQPLDRAYVYFKHEDKGLATRFAQAFGDLWRAGRSG